MRIPAFLFLCSLVVCGACGGGDDAKTPASPGGGGGGSGSGKPIAAGDKIPTFNLESLNGVPEKVKVSPGRVAIVDLWATWCQPCQKSFPKLQELYVKYKGQVDIVAISVDDDDAKPKIPDFAKTYGAKFPVGWGGKNIGDQFKPDNMPSSYIVDKTGTVKFVHKGYHDGDEVEVEKQIKSLL